jgi:hypothetical protein
MVSNLNPINVQVRNGACTTVTWLSNESTIAACLQAKINHFKGLREYPRKPRSLEGGLSADRLYVVGFRVSWVLGKGGEGGFRVQLGENPPLARYDSNDVGW